MFSYFEPNFIEKFLWEKVFFKFWPKSKRCEIKIGYLAAILKQCNIKKKKNPELWFLIVHTYMVQISLQNSGGKVVFLRGGSKLSTLFVTNNMYILKQTVLGHQRE